MSGPGSMQQPLSCTGKPAAGLDEDYTVQVGALTRKYSVHTPASYKSDKPTPVVLNFHGLGSNASQQKFFSKMIDKSDAEGFIAVHPEGTGTTRQSWNGGACCDVAAMTGVDDVGFVKALLDKLEADRCVDTARVFSTGMSNGGFMSHRLACELSERIAAVAPVAGVNGMATCTPSRPMPILHFHGTMDMLVPYGGMPSYGFPPVDQMIGAWATRDACTDQPLQTYKMGDTTCMSRTACGGGSEVILCTVDGGGHTWPGGLPVASLGKTTMDISATDTMWEFFKKHPLPAKQ
jgi:polyhydroxybutyrate depolymerase